MPVNVLNDLKDLNDLKEMIQELCGLPQNNNKTWNKNDSYLEEETIANCYLIRKQR